MSRVEKVGEGRREVEEVETRSTRSDSRGSEVAGWVHVERVVLKGVARRGTRSGTLGCAEDRQERREVERSGKSRSSRVERGVGDRGLACVDGPSPPGACSVAARCGRVAVEQGWTMRVEDEPARSWDAPEPVHQSRRRARAQRIMLPLSCCASAECGEQDRA